MNENKSKQNFKKKKKANPYYHYLNQSHPGFPIGSTAYFHAYADASNESTYFLCLGYIARQPKPESKVYKVIIISVDPKSILCGNKPDIAKTLLGKKIARDPEQLSLKPTGWMQMFYSSQQNWLNIDEYELRKIKKGLLHKGK